MIFTKSLGLTVLALTLALGVPAFAQNTGPVPMPPPTGAPHKGFEHPEFREEMEKIRVEREEIIKERDRLHQREAELHERERALHERMEEAARRAHENNR